MAFRYPIRYFSCRERNGKADYYHLEESFQRYVAYFSTAVDVILGETGIPGLRLDFDFGLRLQVPEGNWHVDLFDEDTGFLLFSEDVSECVLISEEKFYIRWHVDVFLDDKPVFSHDFDLEGQEVFIDADHRAIGDTLVALEDIREFQRIHGCHVICKVADGMADFVRRYYPWLRQGSFLTESTYASYVLWPWMDMSRPIASRIDGKRIPMLQIGKEMLGIAKPVPKSVIAPLRKRQIQEPYVCIGVQASSARKAWLYPGGWDVVVEYLKSMGYRVLCIDRERRTEEKDRGMEIVMPEGAEDFTGDIPLGERLELLAYAESFIGLGSGLSWLAYYADCPVVMIGGFSEDWHEFPTPYRVANRMVCNGCYNDIRVSYLSGFCPYHQGTDRELECQKRISPRQVIQAIERLVRDRSGNR